MATAVATGIMAPFVEKDYWLTSVLYALSRSAYREIIVFKGGTSLAKAYGFISRFSEDVDLALIADNLSGNQVKSRIDRISKTITHHLEEVYLKDVTSKGSRFRRTGHRFAALSDALILPTQAREELIIEINAFANPYPFENLPIHSLIGGFLSQQGRTDILQAYDLAPFTLQVLHPTRTLAEKILALARAAYHPQPVLQLGFKIRHIYDIFCLMQQAELQDFVASSAFFDTLRAVQADDAQNTEFQGAWASQPLSESWIYRDDASLWEALAPVYSGAFATLTYGDLPPLDQVRQIFTVLAERLRAYDISLPMT
ncbi:MAG: nucleotidyl transferase AbiEii/AbiGii toxin family protein [Candidatus Sericytochromatia bacterium]|nr:nucleotidyl transferase AbiEii/AbiGii toxin family protein [Candidatus Sericytochromatia bacterium]